MARTRIALAPGYRCQSCQGWPAFFDWATGKFLCVVHLFTEAVGIGGETDG